VSRADLIPSGAGGMVDRIERKYLSHEVVERLRSMILHENYRPGDRLPPMSDLANELGVGQSSLREGLRQLEVAGFVTIRHGRGVFVVDTAFDPLRVTTTVDEVYRPEDVGLLWQTRRFLEQGNAHSLNQLSKDCELELTECLYKLKANLQVVEGFMKWETEFHIRIAAMAGNRYVTEILEAIWGLTGAYEHKVYQSEERRQTGYNYHKQIRDAILEGKAEMAGRLMNDHLKILEDFILAETGAPSQELITG